ncbi:MAG: GH92 family glycosyl hydrolase, partial [Acidobacteriota bacterium]
MNTDKHRFQNDRLNPFSFFATLRVCGLILFLVFGAAAQKNDFTRWVDPFIGTGGHGHTFPGATMPFGMVQLSPDTRTDNWDGSSGYHYSDDIIYGFSHTHLSGTGIPDYCDILFMPAIAEYEGPKTEVSKNFPVYASTFQHSDEIASPGYYSVKLDDRKILAELTSTARVGFHRYTFPQSRLAGINLDLLWRDKLLDADMKIVGNNRVEGFRRSSSWAKDQVIYFVAEFSRPFLPSKIAVSSKENKIQGAFFTFSPKAGETILVKVAVSPVSIEGARKNLAAELPGWDFDKVRADAKAAWNKELSKIEVSGGTDAQTKTFYTALYHTMIQPNIFNDVDGRYPGHDGKIHQLPGYAAKPPNLRRSSASPIDPNFKRGYAADPKVRQSRASLTRSSRKSTAFPQIDGQSPKELRSEQYTIFSLWDTFRAAHPLYTIIDQKRTADFINTFIRIYEQGGRLPVWELAGNETDCMIGYHAVSVIADAMAKGIKGFDYEKAYEAAKHSAELDRDGLAAYKKRGYISSEDENESVSKTLEYAYDDWCIAQMAKIMGERYEDWLAHTNKMLASGEPEVRYAADYRYYSERARSFENLFDPSTGFMRPKKNGEFVRPFAPNEVTFNFTEGNSWVYSFFVPQDINRLMELQGGREKFAAKLDELFATTDKLAGREQPDITGLIGQYAHGNEPSHHIAYLYDYAGQPWKTQKLVRKIMDEFYKPEPDGLIGNEDCGQMSAWYILSASGIYEVTPGSGIYAFGTPLFKEIKYNLENGKTFIIKAPNVSPQNIYSRSATLNGQPFKKAFIAHEEIMKGGVLEFEMAAEPQKNYFVDYEDPSVSDSFVAVPRIEAPSTFTDNDVVFMHSLASDSKIYYTFDGSEPTAKSDLYLVPLKIDTNSVVRAVAIDPKGDKSMVAEAKFIKRPNDWTVKIASKYNRQYTGGGDEGLIDGI